MAVFRTFAVFLGFCLLTGCASRKYMIVFPTGDHIHLYSHGSWGFDSDIWLRADDSFTVAELDSRSHRLRESYRGRSDGLFASAVRLIQKRNAWKITARSMKADIDAAKDPWTAYGVMDANHEYLDVRFGKRTLHADFYGASHYADMFPSVKSVRTFSQLTKMISKGTQTRAPQSE